mmetsp:Transcript_23959/g.66507  ORF Transcript_23959/g.66507 Transcript_23959/m.66507 type:complete len:145 (-) Transcript_23959:1542-1976(-)
MMKSTLVSILLFCANLFGAAAFTSNPRRCTSKMPLASTDDINEGPALNTLDLAKDWTKSTSMAVTTFSFAAASFVPPALAEQEYAELPPPYVPALFGLGLLVGVGVLTGSLGNVMDEEASLGMQSGARAKKEIERSRSSFFKKR